MGLFRKQGPTVGVRAFVIPEQTGNQFDEENNFTVDGRANTIVSLDLMEADDGQPIPVRTQQLRVPMRNWVRIVLFLAGGNEPEAEELPKQIYLRAFVDQSSRKLVAIDQDALEQELAPYREVGRQWFLHHESAASDLRAIAAAPKEIAKGIRGLPGFFKDVVADIKAIGDTGPATEPAMDAKQFEQMKRTAVQQRYYFRNRPKEAEAARGGILQAVPSMISGVQGGVRHPEDFEQWLVCNEIANLITVEEAAAWRAEAGLPPQPPQQIPGS